MTTSSYIKTVEDILSEQASKNSRVKSVYDWCMENYKDPVENQIIHITDKSVLERWFSFGSKEVFEDLMDELMFFTPEFPDICKVFFRLLQKIQDEIETGVFERVVAIEIVPGSTTNKLYHKIPYSTNLVCVYTFQLERTPRLINALDMFSPALKSCIDEEARARV